MNKQETASVLGIIKANYRNLYKDMTAKEAQFLVDLWHKIFIDMHCDIVSNAVMQFITHDKKGFPPAIGQITDIIYKMSETYKNEKTPEEMWSTLVSALKKSGMHATQEYNKMTPILQKLVGNPENLKIWANFDDKTLATSVKFNLIASYKILLERQKNEMSIDNLKIACNNDNYKMINDKKDDF